ncbi:MAG: lysophospholipid acyltransferase family protein [Verrucomicrobiales bacterium]|nr:lysophospholipid acyltransferase family protein [Verrucomicrobiales bacterium]
MTYIDVRKLFGERIPAILHKPLSGLLAIGWLDQLINRAEAIDDPELSDFGKVLSEMEIDYQFVAGDISLIPAEGPTVIVANHPFGCIDALILSDIISKVRPDSKALANYILKIFPQLHDVIIEIDPFGGKRAATRNAASIRKAITYLKEGGLIYLFPAGEVASFQISKRKVVEKEWSQLTRKLVTDSGASVVPIHFQGRNRAIFHASGLIHPILRTLQLIREMKAGQRRSYPIRIGRPISANDLAQKEKSEPGFLRSHVIRLGKLNPVSQRWQKGRDGKLRSPEELQPIILPIPEEDLLKEISALPPEKCIVEQGSMKVYLAEADLIPNCLREIGRLRELTFRAAGEGTGRQVDLDRYDQWYLHLFLWNEETHQIAGSYRFGPSETILPVHGPDGFYTHSLFKFRSKFFEHSGPIVEMGRSFVVAGQQRSFSSLSLLWKGIGAFLVQNPQYRYALGAVSISSSYQVLSRELIVRFLDRNHKSRQFSKMVNSTLSPGDVYPEFRKKSDLSRQLDSIVKVNAAVSALESDGKGIPVLFRQYLKFETTILGFNVDEDFSGVIDGLILVDFLKTDPVIGHKLLGKGSIDAVRSYYGES